MQFLDLRFSQPGENNSAFGTLSQAVIQEPLKIFNSDTWHFIKLIAELYSSTL